MSKRHPNNSNLHLHYEDTWNGLPVYTGRGPLILNYLIQMYETLSLSIHQYPSTCAIFFVLRFPAYWSDSDAKVISRFIDSLKSQIENDLLSRQRAGKRVHHTRLRYVWVKERDGALNFHYHVAIFVNRETYFTLGNIKSRTDSSWDDYPYCLEARDRVNMADRIIGAWASALNCRHDQAVGAVHFLENGVYKIDRNSPGYVQQFQNVFYRLSYFAKKETKEYGDRSNSFGCSRG